jgi:hypothetical protein
MALASIHSDDVKQCLLMLVTFMASLSAPARMLWHDAFSLAASLRLCIMACVCVCLCAFALHYKRLPHFIALARFRIEKAEKSK